MSNASRTAAAYDEKHGRESYHDVALRYISGLLNTVNAESLLDIGSGTGRAVRYFSTHHPGLRVRGIEPVAELIQEGTRQGVPSDAVIVGSGDALPFADGSFDVVTEFGMLHHVAEPQKVVAEMVRVARRAIFISDGNRFGQGGVAARLAKLALVETGLWPIVDRIRTGGRGYMESEDDGVFWSYSVFDSAEPLRQWSTRLFTVPLTREPAGRRLWRWTGTLLTSPVVLLCAIRD
jgi:SAM-dependent methyltransferase